MTSYRTINPATGELVKEFPLASDQEVQAALTRAHAAYRQWRGVSLEQRAELLHRVAELHHECADELASGFRAEPRPSPCPAMTGHGRRHPGYTLQAPVERIWLRVDHGRGDHPRMHGVHPDGLCGVLDRRRLGQDAHRSFGGLMGEHSTATDQSEVGRDVDDRAVPARRVAVLEYVPVSVSTRDGRIASCGRALFGRSPARTLPGTGCLPIDAEQ